MVMYFEAELKELVHHAHSLERQIRAILTGEIVRCSNSGAQFAGYRSVNDLLRDRPQLGQILPYGQSNIVRRFVEESYRLRNHQLTNVGPDGELVEMIWNLHGLVAESALRRILMTLRFKKTYEQATDINPVRKQGIRPSSPALKLSVN